MKNIKDVKGKVKCMVLGQLAVDPKTFRPHKILRLALIDTFDGSIIKIQETGLSLSFEYKDNLNTIESDSKIEYMDMEDILKLDHKYEPTGNIIKDAEKFLSGEFI